MPKFCVAYISFFNNKLKQKVITADTEFTALLSAFPEDVSADTFDDINDPNNNMEAVYQRCFDCDSMANVINLDTVTEEN